MTSPHSQFYGADGGTLFYCNSPYYYMDLMLEEFSDAYEGEYGNREGFQRTKTEITLGYQFTQNGYAHEVSLDKRES